jgi:hypothetical protein
MTGVPVSRDADKQNINLPAEEQTTESEGTGTVQWQQSTFL